MAYLLACCGRDEDDWDCCRIRRALNLAFDYSQNDSPDHKAWAIDQMVRVLTGREGYKDFIRKHAEGEDGPDTYGWDEGTPP